LSAVIARALALFGPGELLALRVDDADIFRLVLALLPPRSHDGAPAVCAVELAAPPDEDEQELHAAAVIKRCAATITELKGPLPADLLCASDPWSPPPVLARCTRLECLTRASRYTPAVWLGLSQLHTLQDVDLNKVSFAAIAAALPRLHTLTVFHAHAGATKGGDFTARFFTDLLLRLRVFHFKGMWPGAEHELLASEAVAPLPRLQELVLDVQSPYPRCGFLGAQPALLHAPYDLIAACFAANECDSLLARVRDLRITGATDADRFGPLEAARMLQLAPQLRKFSTAYRLRVDASWVVPSLAVSDPAFVHVRHPRLRGISVAFARFPAGVEPAADCASRLRQLHFPRLRELRYGQG
jgi:hypothetical protein